MVDDDGKNCYPRDDIWMTDGYGDYVRHYLRAMASAPQLAPDSKNKLLSTTSIVKQITYAPDKIEYQTFDTPSVELFRLIQKPAKIRIDDQLLETGNQNEPGWNWQALEKGGILTINKKGTKVSVVF